MRGRIRQIVSSVSWEAIVFHRKNLSGWIALLMALALSACIATPRTRAVTQNIDAGYRLGVTLDEELRVVAIDPDSAATAAGVELGDQLVDLTWVLSEVPTDVANAADAQSGNVVTAPSEPLRPPPGVEFKTVPFTAPDEIREMISYGVPLSLQVMRDGESHTLTIVPAPPGDTVDTPEHYF